MRTPTAVLLDTTTLASASVPDWISAVSTAAALVFAAGAAVAAFRQQTARVGYAPDWSALFQQGQLACAMRFRDSSNRWWLRDTNGMLSPADSSTTPTPRHPGSRVVDPDELAR